MKKNFWKTYPLFCIIAAFVLIGSVTSAVLAFERQIPEVTLTDLEGDPALLDAFPLNFHLVDPKQSDRPALVQEYTLKNHTLSVLTRWQTDPVLPEPSNAPETARPLATLERQGYRLVITQDMQDLYHSPDEHSMSIALDVGYLLTICDQNSGQTLYRGRLSTWAGDDAKPYFDARQAPDMENADTFPLASVPQRTLSNFKLKD
ncbi:MAG: hypothetical protein Q3Y08_03375 [Butyricicoccus sp.]|nr:hypothetical protein [Butyricicoccus sp.]